MKELKFDEDFKNPIIDGCKISTSRLSDKDLIVGDEFKFVFIPFENNYDYNLMGVITKVESVKFKNLSRVHAENEGYFHVDLLKHELKHFYPDIRWDTIVYIYSFQVIN